MIKGQVRILVMSVLFCILGTIAYSDPKYGIPTVGVEFREPGHVAVGAIYDSRLRSAKNCNSKMQLRSFSTAQEWLTYRDELRTHIMVSYGLLPAWKKTPLNAHVFDTIVRDDYKVSNVVFESVPGFYVCGNLYEPIAGKGPFPVVLNPMGHWKSRFRHDEPEHPNGCSIPARCITFARQGYVAFSWSIVGGDDMNAISHKGGEMNDWTWGIHVGGLQLWNTIRAIDWITTLDHVDPSRIGCTGASGGGQRTIFISAVDDRIAISAPVCSVSATVHGGCPCANAHGLRVGANNIEIAGVIAPKPMLLVGAIEDGFTSRMMEAEYPAAREIYRLLDAEDQVEAYVPEGQHNYNQVSRNAVYPFFAKHLLGIDDPQKFQEKPMPELIANQQFLIPEQQKELLVFTEDNPRPAEALDDKSMRGYLIAQFQKKLELLRPVNHQKLKEMQRELWPVYKQIVFVSQPEAKAVDTMKIGPSSLVRRPYTEGYRIERFLLTRDGTGEMIPTLKLIPTGVIQKSVVDIIIHPEGKVNLFDSETGIPEPLVSKLIAEGHTIVAIDCFQTGEFLKTGRGCIKAEKPDDVMFTGYNRTNDAWRVQDILTAIAVCREEFSTVNLIGLGEAGIWSLAARPLASGVNKTVVDMARFDSENTTHWCDYLAIPGIRRVGGLKTAAALSAPGQLFMHNINKTFDSEWVKKSYLSMDEADKLKIKEEVLSDEDIVHYLSTHN